MSSMFSLGSSTSGSTPSDSSNKPTNPFSFNFSTTNNSVNNENQSNKITAGGAEQDNKGFAPPKQSLEFGVPPKSLDPPPNSNETNDQTKSSKKRKQKKENRKLPKRACSEQEKRLQKDIKSAVLSSFKEATPSQAKEIAQALSGVISFQAEKLAQTMISRNPQFTPGYQNAFNYCPMQAQTPGMVQIPYQQYQQFMQMCFNREAQITQLMQSNAMLMQKLQQMQNEKDEDEYYYSDEDDSEEEEEE